MLALGLDSGRVMLVDEATGEVQWAVQAHPLNSDVQVAMSPNGRFVASVGSDDDDWKIWDAASGELHMVVGTHDGTVPHMSGLLAVEFSPCGQRLAVGGYDGAVILWDARTGEAEHGMQGEAEKVWAIAFTADGARLACSNGDWAVDVLDATTGEWLRTIEEDDGLTCVSLSPTAISMLATATEDDAIHVWDIDSGKMVRNIAGYSRIAIFSPDGRTIATASTGVSRDVLLMDVESGEMRFRMVGHTDAIRTASWSVDGKKLATGSNDGTCKEGGVEPHISTATWLCEYAV